MKTRTQNFSRLALSAGLTLALGAAASLQAERIEVPLASPGDPVTLRVVMMQGSVRIEGWDKPQVVVEVDGDVATGDQLERRSDGMYRIPNRSGRLSATAEGNEVSVRSGWSGDDHDVVVRVPVRTSVIAKLTNGDELEVRGVTGDHELNNINGDVLAKNLRGSVVAHSSNGDVEVEIVQLESGRALSFVSWNGDVDVTLPAGTSADLVLSSRMGEILTDFEFELLPSEPKVSGRRPPGSDARDPQPDEHGHGHDFRFEMSQDVRARIGGGGPQIEMKSYNGDLYIRRAGG